MADNNYKVGQLITMGQGLVSKVQEDDTGNLYITHPTSGHKSVLVPSSSRNLIGGESVELNPKDYLRIKDEIGPLGHSLTEAQEEVLQMLDYVTEQAAVPNPEAFPEIMKPQTYNDSNIDWMNMDRWKSSLGEVLGNYADDPFGAGIDQLQQTNKAVGFPLFASPAIRNRIQNPGPINRWKSSLEEVPGMQMGTGRAIGAYFKYLQDLIAGGKK